MATTGYASPSALWMKPTGPRRSARAAYGPRAPQRRAGGRGSVRSRDGLVGPHDLHHEIQAEDAEPDDDLWVSFRGIRELVSE